jgi:hypothetical protein
MTIKDLIAYLRSVVYYCPVCLEEFRMFKDRGRPFIGKHLLTCSHQGPLEKGRRPKV